MNGVPIGYARTEDGAIAAAANFSLLSGRDDLFDQEALATAMETLAAPSWKSEASRQAVSGYEYVVDAYGHEAEVSTSVMRYRLTKFTPDIAQVDLWTVTLLSGAHSNVDEVWGIVTVDLEWVDEDWRVTGIESVPGPAPVSLPSDQGDESAGSLMEDFHEFGEAPVP